MKKIIIFLFVFLSIPFNAYAYENEMNIDEYKNTLDNYDLTMFTDNIDDNTKSILKELGVDDFDIYNISSLSFDKLIKVVENIFSSKMNTPLKSGMEIFVFILFSAIIQSFKDGLDDSLNTLYSAVSSIVITIILASKISNTLAISTSVISIAADFIYAFLPTFFIIIMASGSATTSVSTNTLLLSLAQGLSFISSNIFIPFINCFMAMGICSSIGNNLNLGKLIVSIRSGIIKVISVLAATFVSLLSIKTAVASRADAMGLRSMRFAINSVVPVIGSAISEGLLSIQSYSSLIKTSVGIVAIIAIALIFLPSIIEVTLWRIVLSLCCSVSNAFDDNNISQILGVFKDTMLLINVILILSMLTCIVSFGILVAARNG